MKFDFWNYLMKDQDPLDKLNKYAIMLAEMGFKPIRYGYEMEHEYALPENLGMMIKVVYRVDLLSNSEEEQIRVTVKMAPLSYSGVWGEENIEFYNAYCKDDATDEEFKCVILQTQAVVETKLKHILHLERIA